MAKKKKPTTKNAATRRTARRGKKSETDADLASGETSTSASVEATPPETPTDQPSTPASQECTIPGLDGIVEYKTEDIPLPLPEDIPLPAEGPSMSEQQALCKPVTVPVVALHKKFGKYRCLFSNEDSCSKKYDGSDSETNSSVEIRMVDPGASSESDSNAATDSRPASASCLHNFSPLNSTMNTLLGESRDVSPVPSLKEVQFPPNFDVVNVDAGVITETSDKIDISSPLTKMIDEKTEAELLQEHLDENKPEDLENIPLPADEPTEQQDDQENMCGDDDDDDEIFTVVQIVEDDNPEYYYDIQMTSPKDTAMTEDHSYKSEELAKMPEPISEFQKQFENLNLTKQDNLQRECPVNQMSTSEFQYPKDATDLLPRPDPSLTPSSTLSDDSNSSRVPSEQTQTNSNDSAESSPTGVRRSSRIKTISTLKQKTKGYGLVKTPLKKALLSQTKLKLEEISSDSQEKLNEPLMSSSNSPTFPVPSDMPVKVKSRWRRSSELEMGATSPAVSPLASPGLPQRLPTVAEGQDLSEEDQQVLALTKESYDKIIAERMDQFLHLDENEYLCERMISKDTKKMICDCFLTKEEIERGELGCGEDCLNRLLMIECNYRCPVGDRCTNRRFQKKEIANLKVFYANKKGCGVEASVDTPSGEFLMEYVGEVLDYEQFYKRAQAYSDENNMHHYFMSLKGDTVIDATMKGNISRFINHSCDPNAETQKWTVNGELRIGFFSKRDIVAGEEITFDYQFQRFGKEAQRCYCGADNCRGWIGAEPDSDEDDEEEDDDDVSTSKSGATESSEDAGAATEALNELPKVRKKKIKRERRKYAAKASELVQDADIEEDIEALSRTGIKNQSHTLRLSRTVVRAKGRRAQISLLRLLRTADLPCRRLFLDYRGLRLLAPWCADAPTDFKLEMLQTLDRLPVPNKTMVQESRLFTIVERWLSAVEIPVPPPVFIDEATGLPIEIPISTAPDADSNAATEDKAKENASTLEKLKDLSKQLLERWSSLKEVFKIPKKERIQQMKEHERQANVERRAADSSGSRDRDRDRSREERERRDTRDRDRDRDKYRDRERERERERDRERDRERERERDDRDRRKRRGSPESRRSIRLGDRVLAAVPPMSKEERRRAFAEAAAAAEETRRQADHQQQHWQQFPQWPAEGYPQMFPPNMIGGPPNMLAPNMFPGGMMPGMGNMANMGMMGQDMPAEWMGPGGEYQGPPGFCPPYQQTACMPHQNFMGMNGFGMSGFMFGAGQPAGMPFAPQPDAPPHHAAMHEQVQILPEGVEPVLPSMWRSAKDDRGRTYYYHVKLRQPQWMPPAPPPPMSPQAQEESSSEEEEDIVVRRQVKGKVVEGVNGIYEVIKEDSHNGLIPEHALVNVKPRKRRPGLVTERPISPRTEEDKLAGRLEVKRYKETKEKLRRRRERLLQKVRLFQQAAKRPRKRDRDLTVQELKLVELVDTDSDSDSEAEEAIEPAVEIPEPEPVLEVIEEQIVAEPEVEPEELARRIKETFRSTMARVMVHHLNPFRHRTARAGRITNTSDFKHLARKLTHFVMLKELKHCRSVEELVVTDSVRSKAKEFVKKYMAKFGPVYKRPAEEAD